MLLFLMAAGLSLIFGLMNVVSLAHGSFFMLGAFFGLAIFEVDAQFLARAGAGAHSGRRARHRHGAAVHAAALSSRPPRPGAADLRLHLRLLRRGAVGLGQRHPQPAAAGQRSQGVVQIGGGVFPTYRLFLIGFGFALALLLWLFLERSRLGAMVRAGVDDSTMAAGLGAQHPGLVHRRLRRRRGAGRARRRRRRTGARPLSGHGRGHPHPGLHRHRDRRHGKPARRLCRQPAHRRGRYVRQGLSAELALFLIYLVMADRAAGAAARAVRHQACRPSRRDRRSSRRVRPATPHGRGSLRRCSSWRRCLSSRSWSSDYPRSADQPRSSSSPSSP